MNVEIPKNHANFLFMSNALLTAVFLSGYLAGQ